MPRIRLPIEAYRLEEINLPEDLAQQLAGQMVEVEVVPQELPGTRRVEITDSPALIARDGTVWNDYLTDTLEFSRYGRPQVEPSPPLAGRSPESRRTCCGSQFPGVPRVQIPGDSSPSIGVGSPGHQHPARRG